MKYLCITRYFGNGKIDRQNISVPDENSIISAVFNSLADMLDKEMLDGDIEYYQLILTLYEIK